MLVGRRGRERRVPTLSQCLWASGLWALAALVKAPLLITVLPLVAWVLVGETWRSDFGVARRNGLRLALVLLPSCVLFAAWRWWSGGLNAAAPDWEFVPSYRKMVDNWGWYFGSWAQRIDTAAWQRLLRALALRLVGPLGTLLMLWAAICWWRPGRRVDRQVFS